jgi:hypothetical protein
MASALIEEERPDERGKVFAWARDRGLWLHFSAFLTFSVLVHGAGFYLFKVVYPSPVRVEAEPDSITILDPTDPASRAAIRHLSDRTIYLTAPSDKTEVRLGLEAGRVHFAPAFRRVRMELAAPMGEASATDRIEPLETELPRAADPGLGGVRVKLSPELSESSLAPWSILHDYLMTGDEMPFLRIHISVLPDGAVVVEEVEPDLEEEERGELGKIIESTLRFLPAGETMTGWIEIGG